MAVIVSLLACGNLVRDTDAVASKDAMRFRLLGGGSQAIVPEVELE